MTWEPDTSSMSASCCAGYSSKPRPAAHSVNVSYSASGSLLPSGGSVRRWDMAFQRPAGVRQWPPGLTRATPWPSGALLPALALTRDPRHQRGVDVLQHHVAVDDHPRDVLPAGHLVHHV